MMTKTHETTRPTRRPKAAGEEPAKKERRTAAQRIADLEAEIAKVKEREAARTMRADPAVKLTAVAVRALNKALAGAEDAELVQALEAAKGGDRYVPGGARAPGAAAREAEERGVGNVPGSTRRTLTRVGVLLVGGSDPRHRHGIQAAAALGPRQRLPLRGEVVPRKRRTDLRGFAEAPSLGSSAGSCHALGPRQKRGISGPPDHLPEGNRT